jgi:putative transcriptional regulator
MDANKIRELREISVLSQEGLARSLGVAVRTVARWESGASRPSPLAIEKLQRALDAHRQTSKNLVEEV